MIHADMLVGDGRNALRLALVAHATFGQVSPRFRTAFDALSSPSAIAELIAGELRRRGVVTAPFSDLPTRGPLMVWECGGEVHFSYGEHRFGPWKHGALSLGPAKARLAISRLLGLAEGASETDVLACLEMRV